MSLLVMAVLAQMATTPAPAATPDPSPPVIQACSDLAGDAERNDRRRVEAALSHPATAALTGLEDVLQRHLGLHRIERCGDTVRVNSGDADDGLYVQADMVGTITKATASKVRVDVTRSYLLDAAVILVRSALARHDAVTASHWLNWGLSVAPRDPELLALGSQTGR